jgi:hypothetical protein
MGANCTRIIVPQLPEVLKIKLITQLCELRDGVPWLFFFSSEDYCDFFLR